MTNLVPTVIHVKLIISKFMSFDALRLGIVSACRSIWLLKTFEHGYVSPVALEPTYRLQTRAPMPSGFHYPCSSLICQLRTCMHLCSIFSSIYNFESLLMTNIDHNLATTNLANPVVYDIHKLCRTVGFVVHQLRFHTRQC